MRARVKTFLLVLLILAVCFFLFIVVKLSECLLIVTVICVGNYCNLLCENVRFLSSVCYYEGSHFFPFSGPFLCWLYF